MLIHPWDAAQGEDEWRTWLAGVELFGVLAVNNVDPAEAPILVPTHATLSGDEVLLHLARPNPVWPHLEAAEQVRYALAGDYAYVPSYWRNASGAAETDGVPTSYYTSVQLVCAPTIVDDPAGKVEVLRAQVGDLQPEGRHGEIAVDDGPYARLLPGIRALRLAIVRVDAKFKYDDAKPVEQRLRVAGLLDERGHGLDGAVAAHQRSRLDAIGEWSPR
ncbi:MAG TPA: FMN-binding negative transcriptional regulator [Candidatus Nanopelagicales bacterium]|nr:FMN-binding negative transcriptional regulator [Candidatus Nanopelagicales bacterium]